MPKLPLHWDYHFEQQILAQGLFAGLAALNATSCHRFTGVYRFHGDWVKSVLLFDRMNPDLRVGENVPWRDSYCRLTAQAGDRCEIRNSLADARLESHAARQAVQSYCAVLLYTRAGTPLGTLCQFDMKPQATPELTFGYLNAARPAIERYLWTTAKSISRSDRRMIVEHKQPA
jgi:hypothetical protein